MSSIRWFDLEGKEHLATVENGERSSDPCGACGMFTFPREYHPHTACQLYQASRSSVVVRSAVNSVIDFARRHESPSGDVDLRTKDDPGTVAAVPVGTHDEPETTTETKPAKRKRGRPRKKGNA